MSGENGGEHRYVCGWFGGEGDERETQYVFMKRCGQRESCSGEHLVSGR